jgi:hypothetical protein
MRVKFPFPVYSGKIENIRENKEFKTVFPHLSGYLFKIHEKKFEPDPVCDPGKAL